MTENPPEIAEREALEFDGIVDSVVDYMDAQRSGPSERKIYATVEDASFAIVEAGPAANLGIFTRPGHFFGATVQVLSCVTSDSADVMPKLITFGIKLRGVPGLKLLPGEEGTDVCDLLLSSSPGSIMRSPHDHPVNLEKRVANSPFAEAQRRFSTASWLAFKAMVRLIKNPLTINYYSNTPFRLGERVVKYVLVADQRSGAFSMPNFFDRDFLRHGALELLRHQNVRFTFCVQFQQEGESIEDASVPWSGPLIPVAVLQLPRLAAHEEPVESRQLYFHPWRTTREHEPLGWVNQLFKSVWLANLKRQVAA